MASNNDHNKKNKNMKKSMITILLCSSVFYFLYFHAPNLPILLQSFHLYFHDFSTKVFTYKTERNYVFLLFNGILVLIIRFSGLTGIIAPVPRDKSDETEQVKEIVRPSQEKKVVKSVEFVQDVVHQSHEDEEEEEEEEEDQVLEEEELMISRDELNKKCEDFINKVKQEIQRQFHYLTPLN